MFAGALQPPRVSEQEPDDDGDELLLPPSTTCPKKQGEHGQCTESNRLKCRPSSRPGVSAFCTCSREVCAELALGGVENRLSAGNEAVARPSSFTTEENHASDVQV